MDAVWARAKANIRLANVVVGESTSNDTKKVVKAKMQETMEAVLAKCRAERKRKRDSEPIQDLSDERLSALAVYTDRLPLQDYDRLLHIVPRLVNVVTANPVLLNSHTNHALASFGVCAAQLAEAIPVAGTGLKLPLDLHRIASRCSNAYFAPRRFAAVQLAFDQPRCRVLVFRAPMPFEPD